MKNYSVYASSAPNRFIAAKEHPFVQINTAQFDKQSRSTHNLLIYTLPDLARERDNVPKLIIKVECKFNICIFGLIFEKLVCLFSMN